MCHGTTQTKKGPKPGVCLASDIVHHPVVRQLVQRGHDRIDWAQAKPCIYVQQPSGKYAILESRRLT